MAEKEFESTVQALFKGMNEFVTSKTVVGEAIQAGDTIILPLMDVTFGVGAGAGNENNKNGGAAGGMGGKMTPSSVLVIQDGQTRMVNVRGKQDSLTRILEMLPDFVNRFSKIGGGTKKEEEKKANAPEEDKAE